MSHQYSEKTKDSAGTPGPWGCLTVSSSFGPNFPYRTCHRQCSVHCYPYLFSYGITNYTWLCLGPSRPARKGEISLVPRNLEVGRERKKSVWSNWFTGPENKGKLNNYSTCSAIKNDFLPYKMALVMLTTVPRLGTGDTGHKCLSCQFLPQKVPQGGIFCNSQTVPMIKFYIPSIICSLEWHHQWTWY